MTCKRAVTTLFWTATMVVAGWESHSAAAEPAEAAPVSDAQAIRALADLINAELEAGWAREKVTPAGPADDAEFIRRVYLDLAGKVPPVAEVRQFLADSSPDKRRALVDKLLESPSYVTHFSNAWRGVLLPEANADIQIRFLLPSLEVWLRRKLAANTSYAEMVRQLMTTPLDAAARNNPYVQQGEPTPIAFYQAKQLKPENLAAATARAFLGVRIECAQCHDHPFDTWTRGQFWSYAAFFAGLERPPGENAFVGAIRELFDRRELTIPGTRDVAKAAFLDGVQPQWQQGMGSRSTLADWMTSRDNPYFARSAVNRVWGQLFGTGLVDPVDDFTAENLASHPALLDALAREFVAHDFDLKFLIRAITASRAYQLTSALSHPSQENPRLFARMSVKGLTPEQLFDSLAQATGYYEQFRPQNVFAFGDNSPRSEFLETFTNDSDRRTEQQTTILQALAMMNGQFVADATSLERSATLAAVVDFPLMTTAERIETLYFCSVTRPPRADELERLVKYVDGGGPKQDWKQALGDVFWALLNSSEFLLNH